MWRCSLSDGVSLKRSGLTWQVGEGSLTRDQFVNHGALANTNNNTFGPIDKYGSVSFCGSAWSYFV